MGIPGLITVPKNTGSSNDSTTLQSMQSLRVSEDLSSTFESSLDWEAKGFVTPVQSQVSPSDFLLNGDWGKYAGTK